MSSPAGTTYEVFIAPSAEEDLEDIYSYIAKDSPRAAAKFFYTLREKAGTLKRSPLRCARIRETLESPHEYRHLIYKRYRIIFRVQGNLVKVVRIIHGSRQLDLKTLLYSSLR